MQFDLDKTIQILRQTPYTLQRMLDGLCDEWTTEGGSREDWSPYDVIGHLIHGEETDWIPRAEMILAHGENRTFEPYDRLAQFNRSKGRLLDDLLTEFAHMRMVNLEKLARWELTGEQLDLAAKHPALGEVTLRQLLATWVVHDLNHIRQIVRFMARKYETEVGPWKEYLAVLQ